MTAPTGRRLVSGYDYDQSLAGSLIGAIAFFVVGYGFSYSHLGWYQSEFLALEIRAIGSAISTCWVWIANLVVSVAYLTQLETLGPAGTFGLYLGFVLIGWVFVYFCYPESSKSSVYCTWQVMEWQLTAAQRGSVWMRFKRFTKMVSELELLKSFERVKRQLQDGSMISRAGRTSLDLLRLPLMKLRQMSPRRFSWRIRE